MNSWPQQQPPPHQHCGPTINPMAMKKPCFTDCCCPNLADPVDTVLTDLGQSQPISGFFSRCWRHFSGNPLFSVFWGALSCVPAQHSQICTLDSDLSNTPPGRARYPPPTPQHSGPGVRRIVQQLSHQALRELVSPEAHLLVGAMLGNSSSIHYDCIPL